jgi:hypothetical protein
MYFNGSTNNDNDIINSTFYLSVLWESMLVEEVSEGLVYDEVNFIAAVGGNLGLLLGFSCFSLLEKLLDFIKSKF